MMKKNEENERKVRSVLAELLSLHPKEIKSTSVLKEDLGIDSFCRLELCHALEKSFDLDVLVNAQSIPFAKIVTVKDVVDLVTSLEKGKSGKK